MKHYILSFTTSLTLCTSSFSQEAAVADAKSTLGPVAALELAKEDFIQGNLSSLWEAIPKNYQKDMEETLHAFANKVDPDIYDESIQLLTTLNSFLKNKKFLITGLITDNTPADQQEKFKSITDNWDSFTQGFDTFLQSDFKGTESLKKFDFNKTINTFEPKMKEAMKVLAKHDSDGADDFEELKNTKFELVEKDELQAIVKILRKGEEAQLESLARIANRWIPKEMASEWDQTILEAKEGINQMENLEPVQKEQILSAIRMVKAVITELEEAQTKEELQQMATKQGEAFLPMLMPLLMNR